MRVGFADVETFACVGFADFADVITCVTRGIDGRHAHARACRPSIPRVTQVFRRQTGCRRRKSRRRRQSFQVSSEHFSSTFLLRHINYVNGFYRNVAPKTFHRKQNSGMPFSFYAVLSNKMLVWLIDGAVFSILLTSFWNKCLLYFLLTSWRNNSLKFLSFWRCRQVWTCRFLVMFFPT